MDPLGFSSNLTDRSNKRKTEHIIVSKDPKVRKRLTRNLKKRKKRSRRSRGTRSKKSKKKKKNGEEEIPVYNKAKKVYLFDDGSEAVVRDYPNGAYAVILKSNRPRFISRAVGKQIYGID